MNTVRSSIISPKSSLLLDPTSRPVDYAHTTQLHDHVQSYSNIPTYQSQETYGKKQ